MGKKGFRDLIVWQRSKDLAVLIYQITSSGPISKDYSLRDQIRRSVVSIPSNIAEGDERDTDRDSIRFFFIAKGSLAELRTQIEIAFNIGYLSKADYQKLEQECEELAKMLGRLIQTRQKKLCP
ncbi:MAG: four helix bundle protein [Deltaproteobacteria bacterium]|jgi:four helix bundle protein|nr:four helix bundle protein [Deltaproteobacteria bacterium]